MVFSWFDVIPLDVIGMTIFVSVGMCDIFSCYLDQESMRLWFQRK
jgi:hypothetical protein